MYITYETVQYSLNDVYNTAKRVKKYKKVPNDLPKPDFMPTKLVRISDMKVVDGSQVNEGYCALSYSWNQSGDIEQDDNGKYVRVDDGKHEIISYDNIFPDMIIPFYKIDYEYHHSIPLSKLKKMYFVLEIMEDKNYYFTKTAKQVKFDGIIQQICQQFNIKYIWYDQLCINQNNKEEKHHEIRNMHHIYENAYCTVALVPEYSDNQYLNTSKNQYFKRLWTLEEAIKSKRLLFVGRNEHSWGDCTSLEIGDLARSSELNVSKILYHAHQRTSTKDHDRVFALIHLFPEFMDEISIDYDQKFEDLMIQFYILLAKKDISILLFRNKYDYKSTIEKYKFLPSWTGVNGQHFTYHITTSFQDHDIIGNTMHVTTTYATNNLSIDDDNLTLREEDIPTIPKNIKFIHEKRNYHLIILVQLSKAKEMKKIDMDYYGHYWDFDGDSFLDEISEKLQQLSRFMEIKKENLYWCNIYSDDYRTAARIDLDYLTDSLDNPSAQYVILSEISFKSGSLCFYPVIKKEQGEEYYKAIGCCRIDSNKEFFSDCNLNKETFLIQ